MTSFEMYLMLAFNIIKKRASDGFNSHALGAWGYVARALADRGRSVGHFDTIEVNGEGESLTLFYAENSPLKYEAMVGKVSIDLETTDTFIIGYWGEQVQAKIWIVHSWEEVERVITSYAQVDLTKVEIEENQWGFYENDREHPLITVIRRETKIFETARQMLISMKG